MAHCKSSTQPQNTCFLPFCLVLSALPPTWAHVPHTCVRKSSPGQRAVVAVLSRCASSCSLFALRILLRFCDPFAFLSLQAARRSIAPPPDAPVVLWRSCPSPLSPCIAAHFAAANVRICVCSRRSACTGSVDWVGGHRHRTRHKGEGGGRTKFTDADRLHHHHAPLPPPPRHPWDTAQRRMSRILQNSITSSSVTVARRSRQLCSTSRMMQSAARSFTSPLFRVPLR